MVLIRPGDDESGIEPCEIAGYSNKASRSEEHTSELQSHLNLVCRLLLEKKKKHRDSPRARASHLQNYGYRTVQQPLCTDIGRTHAHDSEEAGRHLDDVRPESPALKREIH